MSNNEDEDTYQALIDAGLGPEEAQEAIDAGRPLSEDEAEAIEDYQLQDLTRVDDSEHDQWLGRKATQGTRAMDRVLEDASYGETNMNDDEKMERRGLDHSGWGFRSLTRHLNPVTHLKHLNPLSQLRMAKRMATMPFRLVKKFVPGRDGGKARLVQNAYRKLWYEHANWLAVQDQNNGVPLKSRAEYEAVSKLWAQAQLAKENLPTSYAVSGADVLGAEIMGAEVMGSWWNPLSWFSTKVNVVVNNTAGQRADQPPDEQAAQAASPGDMSTDAASVAQLQAADQQDQQVTQDSATQGEVMGRDEILGDSLGAFATQVLGEARRVSGDAEPRDQDVVEKLILRAGNTAGWPAYVSRDKYADYQERARRGDQRSREVLTIIDRYVRAGKVKVSDEKRGQVSSYPVGGDGGPLPARNNPEAERVVRDIAAKLRAGQAISPSELGLLSTAAKEGNATAQQVLKVLQERGAVVSGDDSGLDPWMYKLNPSYWLASKRKKEFIDKEKKNWKENAEVEKKLAKQKEDLEAAERAEQAAQEVEKAKAQSAETEAKLKAIADSLKGCVAGTLVGHEKPTAISDVVLAALEREGKRDVAGRLYSKIRSGQPLTKEELKQAQQVTRAIGKVRVVHGDLVDNEEVAALHGAFAETCALGAVDAALEQGQKHLRATDLLSRKVASGVPLSPDDRVVLTRVKRDQQGLRRFATSLASGEAFASCPPREQRTLSRGAFVGAAQAMSPEDKKMLAAIVKLAKVGNPRAQRALAEIRKSGVVVSGDSCGFSMKKFFHYSTAPIWLPAKGITKLFAPGGGGKSNPEQVRLAQMRAANQRLKAAQARAAAADSQNEAEQRAQEAIAAAADAEADAADAEAAVKEQAMRTKETEAAPELARQNQSQDDQEAASGAEFVGSWTDFVGKGTREAKLVAKASEESPTGTKIRAAAQVYKRAKAGDPKAVRAVRVMVAKARGGDPQALRDVNAMKAARLSLATKKKAQRKQLVAKARAARRARVVATQRKFEAQAAEKLARMSRRRELAKMAKVERMASRGHPKARAYVAKRVAAAKRGDKKAQAQVQAMRLGRVVRTSVTTRQERQNMRSAERMARRVRAGDPRATRQFMVLQAAAARGNPNAKRALRRVALASAVLGTITTGVVVLPREDQVASKKKSRKLAPGTPEHARAQRQVAVAKEKAKAGVATREELVAAARQARDLGDQSSAGVLAQASSKAPSATEDVKRAAGRVAAAQAGDVTAQKELGADLQAARKGDADSINKLGQVAAARTVEAVEKGQPVPPAMRDAVNLQERARAGDPVAQETLRNVSEAATSAAPSADATAAAVYATGAAAVASALASKPKARREFMERVNEPVSKAEMPAAQAELATVLARVNEGTATPEEGERGVELAMRLHKPRVAAEISAKAPPVYRDSMSTLPDQPLPPVTGVRSLVRASLAALTFSTPDPLGNYREALASRGSPDAVSLGWSPFDVFKIFKKAGPALPVVAMLSAPVAATASVASLFKGGRKNVAPAPAPAPSPAPVPATSPPASPRKDPEEAVAGEDDTFRKLVRAALKSKKMSRDDFNRAVAAHVEAGASSEVKAAAGEQVLKFMEKRGVKVG